MNKEIAIKTLQNRIKEAFESTQTKLAENVYRGHARSISSDLEDAVGLFVKDIMPDGYKIFLDPSIYINGVNNRPDLLVIDENNNVKAVVEVKANMGWCRDASGVINHIVENDANFKAAKELTCEFSRDESFDVHYGDGVKLFLVSITTSNCPSDKHAKNKAYAASKGVLEYNLFTNWYYNPIPEDVEAFADSISC